MKLATLTAGLCLFASSSLSANTARTTQHDDWFAVGATLRYQTEVYKGAGDDVMVLPMIQAKWGALELRGTDIYYTAFDDHGLKIKPMISAELSGYEASDSSFLAGMADRDYALHAGITLEYDIAGAQLSANIRHDVTGENEGFIGELSLNKNYMIDRSWFVNGSIGVKYYSEDYADYYYGVRVSEAIAGRAAYSVDNSINPVVSLGTTYLINENWMLIARGSYEFFDSEIEDSPIVDASGVFNAFFGVAYKFSF